MCVFSYGLTHRNKVILLWNVTHRLSLTCYAICVQCTIGKIRSTGSNRRRSRWPGNIIVDHQGKECIVISSDCAQKCSSCRSTTTRSLIYQPQSLDNGSLRTSHRWRPSVGNSISVLKSTATPICFDSQTMPARPRQKHCLLCSVLLRGCYASANRLTEVSGLRRPKESAD